MAEESGTLHDGSDCGRGGEEAGTGAAVGASDMEEAGTGATSSMEEEGAGAASCAEDGRGRDGGGGHHDLVRWMTQRGTKG